VAIETLVTTSSYASHTSDMTPLQEISDLLKETGYPVSVTTLRRWIVKYNLHTLRRGRADCASWTAILQVHRDEIALRD
jgi:transposase-like protein